MITDSTRHISIVFLFFIIPCFSQTAETDGKKIDFKFESLSIESGLSQSNVRCIFQDIHGFLWIGTQDGLNRFDGNSFTIFKNVIDDSNSLSHNYLYGLAQDEEGFIWIATGGGGICRYDPSSNRFKKYIKDDKNSNLITTLCICIDSDNQIWTGTYLTGLSKYNRDTDSFSSFIPDKNNPKSIPTNIIVSLFEDSEKNLWLGSADAGLIKFNRKDSTFESYAEKNGLASNYVTSICEDNMGNLLVGTVNGLSILDKDKRFKNYYHDANNGLTISSDRIKSLLKANNGNIFIGTEDAGIDFFIPGENLFYNYRTEDKNPFTINDNSVFTFYQDYSGIVWIGTAKGLNKIKNSKGFDGLLGPDSKDPLSGKNVWSVIEDDDKNIWTGTDHGLIRIDTKNDKRMMISGNSSTDKIENKIIYSLSEEETGNIWIGTSSGLSYIENSSGKLSTYYYHGTNDSTLYNIIRSIYIDGDLIWLGTGARGIVKFNTAKKTFTPFKPSKGNSDLLNKYVLYQTYKDKHEDYWFCTTFGLFRYNPGTDELISAISTYDNESKDYTRLYNLSLCLYDYDNYFWIGTSGGGLIKFDPANGIVKRYTEKEGLSNNVVYGILSDSTGNLWLSTNRGISKFNLAEETFKNYYLSDGLLADEFNVQAMFKSQSGKLYFGSINGLVSFYPEKIKTNNYVPPVAITAFKVFDRPYSDKIFFADNGIINLSYSDNFFSFEFASLDYTNPGKNLYAYMLEGFDKKWNYVGSRRLASYTNIDPGKYTFKVKGSNNDGIWNEEGASIQIIIAPPFYNTWWAYVFYSLMFLGALFSLRQYELNKRKRKEETILKEEREQAKLREAHLRAEKAEFQAKAIQSEKEIEKQNIRSRIASDLHDEIGSNLSSIGLLSSILMNDLDEEKIKNSSDNEVLNKLVDINTAARSSAESIRDIVWFTNPMTDQLNSLVTRMTETAAMMLGNINYSFNSGETAFDEKINPEIKRNIYLIYKEALNNIIKHSKANKIDISIKKEVGHFILSIEDNGIGFEEEKIKAGNGLKNINSRAKQINGELEINSDLEKGTTIILGVPM